MITGVLDAVVKKITKTLMINTNGVNSSGYYEKALANCQYWQLIKTFKNPGSGSTIKTWMSKN